MTLSNKIFAIALLALVATPFAQDDEDAAHAKATVGPQEGSVGVGSEEGLLNAFGGAGVPTIGIRYQIDEKMGLVFTPGYQSNSVKTTPATGNATTVPTSSWTIGVGLIYTWDAVGEVQAQFAPALRYSNLSETETAIALALPLRAEYFASPALSFHGKLGLTYSITTDEPPAPANKTETTDIGLGADPVGSFGFTLWIK
jgi:hypothetical protein